VSGKKQIISRLVYLPEKAMNVAAVTELVEILRSAFAM
jgi:hypothetical protein